MSKAIDHNFSSFAGWFNFGESSQNKNMLNRRQIDVQHQNLAAMCRITVKSLIDFACVNTHVDEDCEEFVNFCAVFEQVVSHRIRPYQKKVWHRGQGSPRYFWDIMLESHRHGPLFRSCIPNIEAIETIKSPRAKLRAFVRVALMEKRLSDYLHWLLNNRSLMEECYLDGALFSSEEGLELCGEIIGLSAIDFNFCLKGNESELLGPLEINYAPFLNYVQSSASRLIDEEEMLQLSGKTVQTSDISKQFNENEMKLQNLERDFRGVKEQKDYLEELVRLRERQMGEANRRVEMVRASMQLKEKEWETERKTLDTCILELQEEISNLRLQNGLLKNQVAELQLFKSRLDYRDVQMVDLACVNISGTPDKLPENVEEQLDNSSQTLPATTNQDSSVLPTSDQKSILSGVTDQIRLKEDSQSLVPLTGSLADVNIAMLKDNNQTNEAISDWKKADSKNDGGFGGSKDKDGFVNMELTLFQLEQNKSTNVESVLEGSESTACPVIPPEPTPSSSNVTFSNVTYEGEDAPKLAESFVLAEGESGKEKSDDEMENVTTHPKNDQPNTEEKNERTNDEPCSSQHSKSEIDSQSAISHALVDLGKAFDSGNAGNLDHDPMQMSDSNSNSSSCESNGVGQEDPNTSSMSEPELLDKPNVSSEGSDVAWEVLSDPEDSDK